MDGQLCHYFYIAYYIELMQVCDVGSESEYNKQGSAHQQIGSVTGFWKRKKCRCTPWKKFQCRSCKSYSIPHPRAWYRTSPLLFDSFWPWRISTDSTSQGSTVSPCWIIFGQKLYTGNLLDVSLVFCRHL